MDYYVAKVRFINTSINLVMNKDDILETNVDVAFLGDILEKIKPNDKRVAYYKKAKKENSPINYKLITLIDKNKKEEDIKEEVEEKKEKEDEAKEEEMQTTSFRDKVKNKRRGKKK